METFLLNPNNATQNPVSQQDIATSQFEDSEEFSPVMEEAVANVENAQKQQNSETQENTDHSEIALFETALLGGTSNVSDEDKTNNSTQFAINDSTTADLAGQFTVTNAVFSNTSSNTSTTTNFAGQFAETNPLQSQLIPQPEATEAQPVLPGDHPTTTASSKVESILMQQIQQILDQDRENGTIVIRGKELSQGSVPGQTDSLQNLSNSLLADTEKGDIQARQIGIPFTDVEGATLSTQKSVKLEGAHKDVSEQYFNAKLDQSKSNNSEKSWQNNAGQQGSEQQNKTEVQQTLTSPDATAADAKPIESSFGHQLGQISTATSQTTSIEGKFAPGAHTPVPGKELVDNLIQRFNVNPRLQTSKITMQLHPAELGALKIDILVKNNSISANIVAQSQQVMETLEKNMPRLRAVLEDQGFKIDAFEISMETDSGNQKELFQEQFSSQQQEFAFNNGSSTRKSDAFSVLLDSQENSEETDEETSGVNLTV